MVLDKGGDVSAYFVVFGLGLIAGLIAGLIIGIFWLEAVCMYSG